MGRGGPGQGKDDWCEAFGFACFITSLTTRGINAVKSAQQCATKDRGDSIWSDKYAPKLHTEVTSEIKQGRDHSERISMAECSVIELTTQN